MGKKLAIKGHPTRGNEVIKLLEMMGGSNVHNFTGCNDYAYYVNDGYQNIIRSSECISINEDMQHFTLEEFIEKFPFKTGDKVIDGYGNPLTIKSMGWIDDLETVAYSFEESDVVLAAKDLETANVGPTVDELMTFCECKTIGQGTYAIKIVDGYKFDRIDKNGNIIVKPIKPKYPTTYDECCDVLSIPPHYNLRYHTYEHGFHELTTSNELIALHGKLNIFGKLLICRTAYWKIAGEQMGLDRPWKPDWSDSKPKYTIVVIENKLVVHHALSQNYILAFPTEEIRDAFYENFNDLIEDCKELL